MSQAISLALRERIYSSQKNGISLADISEELSLPYSTIKQLCRRFRHHGASGLSPSYSNCGSKSGLELSEQKLSFIALKEQHLRWGAPRLHLEQQLLEGGNLSLGNAPRALASIRSLSRWYSQAGLSKRRNQGEHVRIGRALAPHNIWEIDAKERLILGDGSSACYLTITDEKSGAWLEAPVFPLFSYQSSSHIGHTKGTNKYF